MSSPFIYSPHSEFFPHFQQPSGFFGGGFNPSFNSPFIPTQTIYPSSPYLGPALSDPSTPNTPERHLFSGLNDYGASMWGTPRRRQRRPSWHGMSSPRVSPFIPPLHLSPATSRRNSWGTAEPRSAGWYPPAYQCPMVPPYSAPPLSAPFTSSYVSGYPQFPAPLQIHPWINGEAPSPEFAFDLSISAFNPQRLVGPNQAVPLSMTDLQSPAFYPPVHKLRILCDLIPNWPVDLVYGGMGMGLGGGMQAPPITLGDILVAIHQKMHQRISHSDWGRLSMSEEAQVSRAFTQRCRTESMRHAATSQLDVELPERQQGVKVVDFLLGKTMLRGLVRSEDGCVKMILS